MDDLTRRTRRLKLLTVERKVRRARRDLEWFLENCWQVKTQLEGGRGRFFRVPLLLRDWQRQFVAAYLTHRRIQLTKGRRIGVTMMCSGIFAWEAIANPETELVYATYLAEDVKIFIDAVRSGFDLLPEWLTAHPGVPRIVNKSTTEIHFSNGSRIRTRATRTGEPARGHGVTFMFLDEFARHHNPESSLKAADPAAEKGLLLIASTIENPNDYFHRHWNDQVEHFGGWYPNIALPAATGKRFLPMFAGCFAVPERDQAWYDDTQTRLGRQTMHREHPRDPDEAFALAGALAFAPDDLAAQSPAEAAASGRLVATGESLHSRRLDAGARPALIAAAGPLQVWRFPEAVRRATIGVDVAEGVGGDWSVAVVLDHDGTVAAVLRDQCGTLEFARALMLLSAWYSWPLTIVERTGGHGISVIGDLYRYGHRALFRQDNIAAVAGNVTAAIGFNTSHESKKVLVDHIAEHLRTRWLAIFDAGLLSELASYVRDARGRYSGAPHDDRVIALGLALHARAHVANPGAVHDAGLVEGSLGWFRDRAAAADPTGRRNPYWEPPDGGAPNPVYVPTLK